METPVEEIPPRKAKAKQYVRNMTRELVNRLESTSSSDPTKIAVQLFQRLFERGFADVVIVPPGEQNNLASQLTNLEIQEGNEPYFLIKVTDDEIGNPTPSAEQYKQFGNQVVDCVFFWNQQTERVKSEFYDKRQA